MNLNKLHTPEPNSHKTACVGVFSCSRLPKKTNLNACVVVDGFENLLQDYPPAALILGFEKTKRGQITRGGGLPSDKLNIKANFFSCNYIPVSR